MQPANRVVSLVAGAFIMLSLTAFSYASMVPTIESCYAEYDASTQVGGPDIPLPPSICKDGTCTFNCKSDRKMVWSTEGGFQMKVWCECDGVIDGTDSNKNCHAVVVYDYLPVGSGWELTFASVTCEDPCVSGTCASQEPATGWTDGDKLCGCN